MKSDNAEVKQDLIKVLIEEPHSVEELMALTQVSQRSIYRWLAALPAAGYELIRIRQEGGPWRYKITSRPRAATQPEIEP